MSRTSMRNLLKLIDSEKEELTSEQSFLNDLKRSIELTEQKNSRKPTQTYKPSSMNCIRQSYYQLTGAKEDEKNYSYVGIGICNSGSDIHIRIQTAIQQMADNGIDCEWIDVAKFVKQRKLKNLEVISQTDTETKLNHKTLNMHFMCDGIVRYKGKYYIIEIKSEANSKFSYRQDVDPSHYKQGTAYSLSFGLDDIIFIYVSRDLLDMKSFLFTPTKEMKEDLVSYIEECDECVKKLTPPKKPIEIEKKTCNYCNYKNQCRKDG